MKGWKWQDGETVDAADVASGSIRRSQTANITARERI